MQTDFDAVGRIGKRDVCRHDRYRLTYRNNLQHDSAHAQTTHEPHCSAPLAATVRDQLAGAGVRPTECGRTGDESRSFARRSQAAALVHFCVLLRWAEPSGHVRHEAIGAAGGARGIRADQFVSAGIGGLRALAAHGAHHAQDGRWCGACTIRTGCTTRPRPRLLPAGRDRRGTARSSRRFRSSSPVTARY